MCEQGVAEAGDDDARAIELLAQAATIAGSRATPGLGSRALAMGWAGQTRFGDPACWPSPRRGWRTSRRTRSTSRQAYSSEAAAGEATLDIPLPFYLSPRAALAVRMTRTAVTRGAGGRSSRSTSRRTTRPSTRATSRTCSSRLRSGSSGDGTLRATTRARCGTSPSRRPTPSTGRSGPTSARSPRPTVGYSTTRAALAEAGAGSRDSGWAMRSTSRCRGRARPHRTPRRRSKRGRAAPAPAPGPFLRSGYPPRRVPWRGRTRSRRSSRSASDEAAARLEQYEHDRAGRRRLHLIAVARVRGLVAAARGDTEGALSASLEQAVAARCAPTFPFERGAGAARPRNGAAPRSAGARGARRPSSRRSRGSRARRRAVGARARDELGG